MRLTPYLNENTAAVPPEGPTLTELASEVETPSARGFRALQRLLDSGGVKRLAGRPVRSVMTEDDA